MRMRVTLFVLALASAARPALPQSASVTQRVTVVQLEQTIANAHSRWNWRLAKQISGMRLTERLSEARLVRLERELHNAHAREALMALADESAFLDLPAADVPSRPAPDAAEQAELLRRSVDSAKKTIDGWPNFIATREMTRFEGTASVIPDDLQDELFSYLSDRAPPAANWECPGEPKIGHQRISLIDQSSVTVVNRNGEELHALGERGGEFECPENGVSTTEEFGKVLWWVPRIVAHSKVEWSHWESGASGLVAVFRYSASIVHRSIPVEVQGEIAINPADGSILRLSQMRRWTKHEPASDTRAAYDRLVEYDSAIDYGAVTIGGSVYICPVKRVALYLTPILRPKGLDSQDDEIYRRFALPESPLQEYLNDIAFTHYRLYGAPS
jgi:hypothetical protein